MKVVSVSDRGAACLDESGVRHEEIAVELVAPVEPGDLVLVHAGVAIG